MFTTSSLFIVLLSAIYYANSVPISNSPVTTSPPSTECRIPNLNLLHDSQCLQESLLKSPSECPRPRSFDNTLTDDFEVLKRNVEHLISIESTLTYISREDLYRLKSSILPFWNQTVASVCECHSTACSAGNNGVMIPSEEKCVVHMVQNKLKDLFGWINNYVLGVRRLNLTCRVPLSIRRDLHIIEERVKLVTCPTFPLLPSGDCSTHYHVAVMEEVQQQLESRDCRMQELADGIRNITRLLRNSSFYTLESDDCRPCPSVPADMSDSCLLELYKYTYQSLKDQNRIYLHYVAYQDSAEETLTATNCPTTLPTSTQSQR